MSSPIKVAVLDDYQGVALSFADWKSLGSGVDVHAIREQLPEGAVADRLRDFEIIVAMRERTPFPRTLIEKLPNLKLLVTTGRRNASIDIKAAAERGIPVCGTATQSTGPTELTWGLILSLARHIPKESMAMRTGAWQTTVGTGLHGKVLGVLGLGRLGTEVARIGQAFGMSVVAWSQNLTADAAAAVGARLVDKAALFRDSDIVSIHVVLSGRTRHLVGEAELNAMKPTALLINTARGPIVDEAALVAALRARRIAGAGIDVFDQEPLPANHPLRSLDNALLTPHIGYVTAENYRGMYAEAVDDIRAFLAGSPVRVIAPQ